MTTNGPDSWGDIADPKVLEELRELAARITKDERQVTLRPSDLVQDLVLKIHSRGLPIPQGTGFRAYCSTLMFHHLVDVARRRKQRVEIDTLSAMEGRPGIPVDLVGLAEALDDLERGDARKGRIARMRAAHYDNTEIAEDLGVTVRTVELDMVRIRGFLRARGFLGPGREAGA